MRFRFPVFLFVAVAIYSCSGEPYYEKEFYEKVSGIEFPASAKAIESIDNGEFVTTTVFRVDSTELLEFIRLYQFDTTRKQLQPALLGNAYLKANHLGDSKLDGFYLKGGDHGKNSWLYLADPGSKKLWAEIVYPDWANN